MPWKKNESETRIYYYHYCSKTIRYVVVHCIHIYGKGKEVVRNKENGVGSGLKVGSLFRVFYLVKLFEFPEVGTAKGDFSVRLTLTHSIRLVTRPKRRCANEIMVRSW
jgi:hypothetical protein